MGGGRRGRSWIRAAGVVVSVVLWVVLIGAALEAWERFRFYRLSRENAIVEVERNRRIELEAALDSSLWEQPWRRYRPSSSFSFDVEGRRVEIRTNRFGFRASEVALPKPPGVVRIVCIGGSTTVEGRTNETTYPALLQERLRADLGTGDVEVVNCGISGLTSGGERQKIPEYLALEPDLLVEYGCINDLAEIAETILRRSAPRKRLVRTSHFLTRHFPGLVLPGEERMRERLGRKIFNNLTALHEEARAVGVEVAFASFAVPDPRLLAREERDFLEYTITMDWRGSGIGTEVYRGWVDLYNQELAVFCDSLGAPYLPIAETMPRTMEHFTDFCHMTEVGIETKATIFAEALTPIVAELLARRVPPHGSAPGW